MSSPQVLEQELAVLDSRIRSYMQKMWLTPEERAEYDSLVARRDEVSNQLNVARMDQSGADAVHFFGPEHGGSDPDTDLSVPVPPASSIDTGTGVGPDPSIPIEYAPPVPGQTSFLPLTGADQYDETIRAIDRAMAEVNDQAFNLNPDDMWMPDGAQLGGPGGPSTISGLAPVADKMRNLTAQVTEQFSALGDTINAPREGTWPARLREMYKPTLESANEGVVPGGPAANATDLTGESGGGASGTFDGFQKAISDARYAIADLYGVDEYGNRYLDTSRALALDPSILQETQATMQNMAQATAELSTAIDPWDIRTRLAGNSSTGDVTPAEGAPTPPAPASGSGGGGFSSGGSPASSSSGGLQNELDDLLGSEQPAAGGMQSPMGGMPQMPQMPSMGGMPQMPQMPSFGEQPSQEPEVLKAGDTELSSDANAAEARPSAAASTSSSTTGTAAPEGTAATNAVMQNAIPKPGDPVRPGALGADGKLLDKDGDGRMDKDALAATRENADQNKDGIRDKFSITIDAQNRSVDVVMDDPRLAEMMTRLAEGEHGSPVDILQAAKDSGMELDNLGEKIDTMAILPGDVVTGTDRGMYLGDGLVLTEQGEVKSLVDVMDFRVSDPEVFRLPVPDLPSSDEVIPEAAVAAAANPSSETDAPLPSTAQAAAESPAITDPPTTDPPAAETPDDAEDALSAMLSGGSDGGPAEVAYQGHALGGEEGTAGNGPAEVAYQGRALG